MPKQIIIVGGGFAGLNFVRKMGGSEDYQVTLVDQHNYHFFPPLLYQVATAFIEPSNISYPFRRLFQEKKNLRFHLGKLLQIDTVNHRISTDTGELSYDYLVLALGTETNYFGMENVRKHALPMKNINDALTLRNRILLSMEEAVRAENPESRERLQNIVIAGGGPSGVEVAGMLAEMGRYIADREYPEIKDLRGHIYLIDAGPDLLGAMSEKARKEAQKVLGNLGVHIILNTSVKDFQNGLVLLSDGRQIPSHVLIWTSGVTARTVPGIPKEALGRGGRILVDAFNAVTGVQDVYALGDISFMEADPDFPKGHPQLAQVAIQQGELLAENLKRKAKGQESKPFRYNDKGSMAIISKYKAVVDLPKFFFKGFMAWFVWLFIHIIPLVGFRNKVKLAFNWFWSFISNDPTLRLIIGVNRDKAEEDV